MELSAETSPNGIRESKGCSTRALSWASAPATVPPRRCAQQRQVGARARPGPSPPLRGSTSSSRRISPPRLRPSRPHSAAMRSRPGPCSSHRPLPVPTPARPAADPRASRSTIPSWPRNRTSPSRTPQTLRKQNLRCPAPTSAFVDRQSCTCVLGPSTLAGAVPALSASRSAPGSGSTSPHRAAGAPAPTVGGLRTGRGILMYRTTPTTPVGADVGTGQRERPMIQRMPNSTSSPNAACLCVGVVLRAPEMMRVLLSG